MNISEEKLLFEGDTELEHYQVVDMVYEGRQARILFSGHHAAAQSGAPKDDNPEPLFDYNKRFIELIQGIQPQRLLLIGGGAFTLPTALLYISPSTITDVIEIDSGLTAIAKNYFDLSDDPRLRIINTDGRNYLERNTTPYDLILIDAFHHDVIPRSISSIQAVALMRRSLSATGLVAANIISTYRGHRADVLLRHYATYKEVFKSVHIFPADSSFSEWQSQNFILTAQKNATEAVPPLRFPALSPTTAGEVLLDKS